MKKKLKKKQQQEGNEVKPSEQKDDSAVQKQPLDNDAMDTAPAAIAPIGDQPVKHINGKDLNFLNFYVSIEINGDTLEPAQEDTFVDDDDQQTDISGK